MDQDRGDCDDPKNCRNPQPEPRAAAAGSCGEGVIPGYFNPYTRAAVSPKIALNSPSSTLGQIFRRLDPLFIFGMKEADGPVGAKHEPLRAECFEHRVKVGPQRVHVPAIRLGDHPEILQVDVFRSASSPDGLAHGLELAFADQRLADVVEHEWLLGVAVHELDGLRQVALEDEDS